VDRGGTSFKLEKDYTLRSDNSSSAEPIDQILPSGLETLAIHTISILAGVGAGAAMGPIGGISVGSLVRGLVKAGFDIAKTKNRKRGPPYGKITFRYFKWYSWNRWYRKPAVLVQDMSMGYVPKALKSTPAKIDENYELRVTANTGRILPPGVNPMRFGIGTSETGMLEFVIPFRITWKKP